MLIFRNRDRVNNNVNARSTLRVVAFGLWSTGFRFHLLGYQSERRCSWYTTQSEIESLGTEDPIRLKVCM